MLTYGDLFTGIAGFGAGLELAGIGPCLWQVERDSYCTSVLEKRFPNVKRYRDVCDVGNGSATRELLGLRYDEPRQPLEYVDVICGGFPCTDISLAGAGAGLEGAASGLWFEYLRIIRNVRPRYVAIENVPALAARGLVTVLSGLAQAGYDALWFTLAAKDVGAPHKRERLFVVAWRVPHGHGHGHALRQLEQRDAGRIAGVCDQGKPESGHVGESVADANVERQQTRAGLHSGERSESDAARSACDDAQGRQGLADSDSERCERLASTRIHERWPQRHDVARCGEHAWPPGPNDTAGWAEWTERGGAQPGIRGSADGLPFRLEQLQALGNAVVPQVAEVVGHVILQLEAMGVAA